MIKKESKLKSLGSTALHLGIYLVLQVLVSIQIYGAVFLKLYIEDFNEMISMDLSSYNELMNLMISYSIPILIVAGIITIFISFAIFQIPNRKPFTSLKMDTFSFKYSLIALVLVIPVMSLSNFIVDLVLKISPSSYSTYADSIVKMLEESSPLVMIIGIGIIAPLVEEFLFRGVIFSRLRDSFPLWGALLIQAAVFAIFHGNLIQMSYAFFVGLILGVLVYKSGSIYPAVILHMANNSMSLFTDLQIDNILYYILPLVAIAITLIVLFNNKDNGIYKSNTM